MNECTFLDQIASDPLGATVRYYAGRLDASPKAGEFLQRCALGTMPAHSVGFADRTLGNQIPPNQRKRGREIRQRLAKVGVLRATGHETLCGCVTVPLSDERGRVTGIFGIPIDGAAQRVSTIVVGSGIFNGEATNSFIELILCENVIDAWTYCAAGHANAIASCGVEFTSGHFRTGQRLLLSGESANQRAFADRQFELCRVHFPEGMSVNRFAILHRGDCDALGKRIRDASWLSGTPSAPPLPSPQISPLPSVVPDVECIVSGPEVALLFSHRRWRIRGLDRNRIPGVMKVNVLVCSERTGRSHVDSIDLYHARSRRTFLKEVEEETGESEADLRSDAGRVLLKLEQLQDQFREQHTGPMEVKLSDEERGEAIELLRDENLLDRILRDFETCGVVGEQTGKLAGYLVATSRLLDKPLGLIIQSSSAAGKSTLADAILQLMPPEACFCCSAMTRQSLYYLGGENLKHKILSITEEQGVRASAYPIKLLQSEGRLSRIATNKECGTGRPSAQRYEVEGPVALMMTTTAIDIDGELLNRCLVVSIDESAAQTAAIHTQQRFGETMEGFEQRLCSKQIVRRHQNAQRLLRPLTVFNPYADQLAFVGSQTRHRRDHHKYLQLIRSMALLFQYQHDVKEMTKGGQRIEYIEVTKRDIARANTVADSVLGRSIDELSGPTRGLLLVLYDWVRQQASATKLKPEEIRFTRRDAREALHWSTSSMRIHLDRLVHHEHVLSHGGGRGKLYQYSLLYDGRGHEGQRSLPSLVEPATLVEPSTSAAAKNQAYDR